MEKPVTKISNEMLVAAMAVRIYADHRMALNDAEAETFLARISQLGPDASLQDRVRATWESASEVVRAHETKGVA
jgi:hypothetical protein